MRAWLALAAAELALVLGLFGPALFEGRVFFFRDLSTYYAPAYAFAAPWLKRGVWPLWNPMVNAGEPFLLAYPPDLLALWLGGARAALGIGPVLHVLLAMAGGSVLARRLGMGPWGCGVTGTVYGLGGFVLSTLSLVQLFQAAAWAPWVIAAFLAAARQPTPRRVAALAVCAALQASTLGAEVLVQTAMAGIVLLDEPAALRDRRWLRLAGSGVLALLLAAPALLGARALVTGSAREQGFDRAQVLAFSLHPAVLGEIVLPKLLGDPHAFSDADYWGRAYFPEGYPYLVSVYLGLPVLLLAVSARGRRKLWFLAAAGVLLSLGAYGPLGLLPEWIRWPLRGPQKLFFLVHLAVALLAGFGLERRLSEAPRGRGRLGLVLPGLAWLGVVLALPRGRGGRPRGARRRPASAGGLAGPRCRALAVASRLVAVGRPRPGGGPGPGPRRGLGPDGGPRRRPGPLHRQRRNQLSRSRLLLRPAPRGGRSRAGPGG